MHAGAGRQAVLIAALACAAGAAEAQHLQGSFKRDFLQPRLEQSCASGAGASEREAIDLSVSRVHLQVLNPQRTTIGELTLVGGFHLTSSDHRFGGLSGLDLMEDGGLLAVSDAGDLVWIALDADGAAPLSASLAGMRDHAGLSIRGKAQGDAEGLAVMEGVALVSFEGNHRVLAFDVERCGASALGVTITAPGDLAAAFGKQGLDVGGNAGVESIAVAPGWFMLAGLETKAGDASALSARAIEALPEFDVRIAEGAPPIVGLDIVPNEGIAGGVTAYSLHRSTNAVASEMIVVMETVFEPDFDQSNLPARIVSEIDERSRVSFTPVSSRKLAAMNLLTSIDNFEGIAARRMPDGRVRLYVISDDNFSDRQRTLLMIYDVRERG